NIPDHGRDALPAPYSMSTEPVVSTPAFSGGLTLFRESIPLSMSCRTPSAAIHYTLDGSEPTEESPLYTEPLVLSESAQIRAKAFKEGMQASPEASAQATKAFFRPGLKLAGLHSGCRYTYHLGTFSETADVRLSP
ncbi:MAG: chitobiase/beta-hexosaminidase C-terminal domain-containing protein, partial [Bacteroidales bacterium]|nr:chitobiase/beta-hexosaminidase C-terminal domain-containing protein [Bacteroidales bacterium]